MEPVKCFFLRETGKLERSLRRYRSSNPNQPCPNKPGQWSYHDVMVPLDIATVEVGGMEPAQKHIPHDDPRWPTACVCGMQFEDSDEWQIFTDRIYTRTDNGDFTTLRKAPPGAMWDAWWLASNPWWRGPDGMSLHVRCRDGHDWCIDGQCSNCTRPSEPHKCWVRHGIPPEITVDKGKDGESCAAGAGSIQTPAYHGFLRSGMFVQA